MQRPELGDEAGGYVVDGDFRGLRFHLLGVNLRAILRGMSFPIDHPIAEKLTQVLPKTNRFL